MNPHAQLWLAALRSGKYKQGRQYLRRGDEFCCLGVACEVARNEGLDISVEVDTGISGATLYGAHAGVLPPSVQEWLGLRNITGTISKLRKGLVQLNDTGTPFSEIADFIEAHEQELFQ